MRWFTLLLAGLALLGSACSGNPAETPYAPVIDPADFTTTIDNPYFPLVPGTTLIYEGVTADGTERIVDTVTTETKVVLGVTCVVVHNLVTLDGELIEETYDWYAQDKEGNVWYFGEDTAEYENGVVVSTQGAWQAGVDGAQPGIIMLAQPKVGAVYRQEYYQGEAEDMAEVISLSESITVPTGSYVQVLMTREWTPLQPGVAEHKYYAAGVGLVLEEIVEGGAGRIELISIQADQ